MVDDQDRNAVAVTELFHGSDVLVVRRIVIVVIPAVPDLLECVHDDQACVLILGENADQCIADCFL